MPTSYDECRTFTVAPDALQATLLRFDPNTRLFAIGIIANSDGFILTLDDPATDKTCLLPDAFIQTPFDERSVTQVVPERFGLTGDIVPTLSGKVIAAKPIVKVLGPRAFVPVIYRGANVPRTDKFPPTFWKATKVWREPGRILSVLRAGDFTHTTIGTQQRGIVRLAIEAYIDSPASR